MAKSLHMSRRETRGFTRLSKEQKENLDYFANHYNWHHWKEAVLGYQLFDGNDFQRFWSLAVKVCIDVLYDEPVVSVAFNGQMSVEVKTPKRTFFVIRATESKHQYHKLLMERMVERIEWRRQDIALETFLMGARDNHSPVHKLVNHPWFDMNLLKCDLNNCLGRLPHQRLKMKL
jgi:hypothetical protein